MKEFSKSGFPKIRLSIESFEVCRTIEKESCVTFDYSDIQQIEYCKVKTTWSSRLKQFLDYSINFWYHTPNHVLKITKENKEVWTYECDEYYNDEFAQIIRKIIEKSGLQNVQ